VIDQYLALGDGLSMDPLLAETPTTSGPASLLASELARNHSLAKYKNLCRERSRMSSIWLNALPSILPSRGQVVVTITTGLEDIVDMGLELSTPGQVRSAVQETVSGYRRLVRTLRRLLPNALIIGTSVPVDTSASRQFNELLHEYAEGVDGFVVADVSLDDVDGWSSRQHYQLNTFGCEAIAAAWLCEIQKAGLISNGIPVNA
jgi:hypothetical protein